jgi:hypothetical protein
VKVTWLGVTRVLASGTSKTAANGRATKVFHRMSLGFFVRRYESAICENRLTVKATPRRNAYGHRNGKP